MCTVWVIKKTTCITLFCPLHICPRTFSASSGCSGLWCNNASFVSFLDTCTFSLVRVIFFISIPLVMSFTSRLSVSASLSLSLSLSLPSSSASTCNCWTWNQGTMEANSILGAPTACTQRNTHACMQISTIPFESHDLWKQEQLIYGLFTIAAWKLHVFLSNYCRSGLCTTSSEQTTNTPYFLLYLLWTQCANQCYDS